MRPSALLKLVRVFGPALVSIALGSTGAQADSEFPVCTVAPSIQWMPAASGTRIVWVDQRNGSNDIYLYDMATHTERPVCVAPDDQMWPEMDGDHVVWMDHRSGQWEVYLFDLSTNQERCLASAPIEDIWHSQGPDISGNYVVWADNRSGKANGGLDVLVYSLTTGTLTQITHDCADQGAQGPRISRDRIVWCDRRNGNDGDIYMQDISTGAETLVASGSISQGQPDIAGDMAVWTQAEADSFDIWYADLAGGKSGLLVSAPYTQDHPRANGRWVVWSDDRNGGGDTTKDEVYAYDLVKHRERPLSASPYPYGNLGPAIAETGIVAWMDFRNGDRTAYTNPDIYGYVLAMFTDVLATNWSFDCVEACVVAGIVSGYLDGTYHPEYPVTRDQMAAYISRALAGGDENVPPKSAYPVPSFTDVLAGQWAYNYIEYAVSQNVVKGYEDGSYQPGAVVDRGQMAVFIAHALVAPGGDAAIPDPTGEPSFSDVPSSFWAYNQVEYIAGQGVVKGYEDGLYHPERTCTRDQMAVYVAKAFDLPL